MLAVAIAATMGGTETVRHLAETVLWRYTGNTLLLVTLVAIGTTAIGTGAAWLVTMTRFPGVRVFEVALALPLAFPAYVLAYAYTDFLDHPGAVQTALRTVTGWGPRDYWFPEVRSLPGAAVDADAGALPIRLPPCPRGVPPAVGDDLPGRPRPRAVGLGRVPPGVPAACPPGHRGRRAAGDDGDHRGLRHGVLLRGADLRDRHLHELVLDGGPGRGGAAGTRASGLRASDRASRTDAARSARGTT